MQKEEDLFVEFGFVKFDGDDAVLDGFVCRFDEFDFRRLAFDLLAGMNISDWHVAQDKELDLIIVVGVHPDLVSPGDDHKVHCANPSALHILDRTGYETVKAVNGFFPWGKPGRSEVRGIRGCTCACSMGKSWWRSVRGNAGVSSAGSLGGVRLGLGEIAVVVFGLCFGDLVFLGAL